MEKQCINNVCYTGGIPIVAACYSASSKNLTCIFICSRINI